MDKKLIEIYEIANREFLEYLRSKLENIPDENYKMLQVRVDIAWKNIKNYFK